MPKPVYTGWIRREGINVVGEIEDQWGWKIHLHGVPGKSNGYYILTGTLGNKPIYIGWIHRVDGNVVGEIEDAWGWKIYLHGVPGRSNSTPAFILTGTLGETPTALRIEAIDGPVKT